MKKKDDGSGNSDYEYEKETPDNGNCRCLFSIDAGFFNEHVNEDRFSSHYRWGDVSHEIVGECSLQSIQEGQVKSECLTEGLYSEGIQAMCKQTQKK